MYWCAAVKVPQAADSFSKDGNDHGWYNLTLYRKYTGFRE